MGDSGWRGLAAVQAPSYPPRPLSQVIQGLLIGRLSRHFSEEALLWASVLVFSLVGLAMVRALPPPMPPAKSRGLGPLPHRPHLHWSPWAPPTRAACVGPRRRGPARGRRCGAPGPGPSGTPVTTALSCQALMSNVLHFCLLVPGLVFSLCVLNVVTDSMLTKAVSASDTGERCGGGRRGPGLGTPQRSSPESLIWVGVGDLGSWARWDSGPRRLR